MYNLNRPQDGGGLRVLVIDDSPNCARVLAEAFWRAGLDARVRHDTPEALTHATDWQPDVVLLRLETPPAARATVARLRSRLTSSPFILLSCEKVRGEGKRRSPDDCMSVHIPSPDRPGALRTAVRRLHHLLAKSVGRSGR
jgi:CheY-like chemotaxis protein